VKGINFVNLRDAGDAVELAQLYSEMGADELTFLDITATIEKRKTFAHLVKRISSAINIPFTVGGGLRSVGDMRRILEAGADKVSVNTAAVQSPQLITEGAKKFGNQCIVIAIDARRMNTNNLKWEVCTHGGRNPTGIDAVEWSKEAVSLGAGEVLLTSWDADGQKAGYDLALTRAVSEAVTVPVIASGGAGTLEHLCAALTTGKADAVLAASIFHYKTYSIAQVKTYLAEQGIPVRI